MAMPAWAEAEMGIEKGAGCWEEVVAVVTLDAIKKPSEGCKLDCDEL